MRKVAICNFNGGVGKTTCAINLAIGFARAGRYVLLLDNDAREQGDAGDNGYPPVKWLVAFICHSNPEKPQGKRI
jgi:hypothetical protein